MLQRGTNIMTNQVKTQIQNYFIKVLHEHLTFVVFKSCQSRDKKIVASPCVFNTKTISIRQGSLKTSKLPIILGFIYTSDLVITMKFFINIEEFSTAIY